MYNDGTVDSLSPSAVSMTPTPTSPSEASEGRGEQRGSNEIDQFLLTALNNPRDRLTLLKLDEELGQFLDDPQRTRLDYPHNSSYQRLIIHRVAEYFKLDHVVMDVEMGKRAVVLFKNSDSQIPIIRFSDLIEQQATESVPSTSVKIMRRSPYYGYTILSPPLVLKQQTTRTTSSHSERTQQQNQTTVVDKSLEKREEEYAKARARIFGSTQETPTETPAETLGEETKKQERLPPSEQKGESFGRTEREMWTNNPDFHPSKEVPEFYPRNLSGKGADSMYSNQYPMLWGESSLYKNYLPPGAFPPTEPPTKSATLQFSQVQNTNGPEMMPQNIRTPSPPIPGYFRSPPPLIYTFPNEDVWSFYSGNTFHRAPAPADSFYYPYERRPPRSTGLFDPHAPEKDRSKMAGQESLKPRQPVPRSPSHESFFQNGQGTTQTPGKQQDTPSSEIGHILELNGLSCGSEATEEFLHQIKQSGANVKWLDNTRALGIYKTANAAKIALANISGATSFQVKPWRVVGIEK